MGDQRTFSPSPSLEEKTFSPSPSLEELRARQATFAAQREWGQFHTPRNLVLALVGEVGELSEIFQWKGEVPPGLTGWTAGEREHLGEELSDVLMYLIRLSDVCGIDLPEACARKMAKNAAKYPVELVRGSAKKYDEYGLADELPDARADGAVDADAELA
jgi:dCTP diphosphatase